jgi:hypothetical protein
MTVEEDERLAALADSVAASQLRHDERVSSGFQATASSSHGMILARCLQNDLSRVSPLHQFCGHAAHAVRKP